MNYMKSHVTIVIFLNIIHLVSFSGFFVEQIKSLLILHVLNQYKKKTRQSIDNSENNKIIFTSLNNKHQQSTTSSNHVTDLTKEDDPLNPAVTGLTA